MIDKNEKELNEIKKENGAELTSEQLDDVSGGKIYFENLHDNKKDSDKQQSNFI